MNIDDLCRDLLDERAELLGVLSTLDDDGWHRPTPAPGWTVLDQAAHLAFFDDATRQAVAEPDTFRERRRADRADAADGGSIVDRARDDHAHLSGAEVLTWLTRSGEALVAAARSADPAVRVPWYGPDMSLASALTARIMETWAHGQDVLDALGVTREPSGRLGHIVFLGYRALPYSFTVNDRPVPDAPVRVEVGEWAFGPEDAENRVSGDALDFCLVVTQRRHLDDTDLVVEGPVAAEWMGIAQAFAGPPGGGRRPGSTR
jgi:uncharacterized protein (TIGR03084 family)